MSLLLDALKRAALEKKQRDYFSAEVSLEENKDTANNASLASDHSVAIQDYIADNEAYSTDAAPAKDETTRATEKNQPLLEETDVDSLSFDLSEVEFLDSEKESQPLHVLGDEHDTVTPDNTDQSLFTPEISEKTTVNTPDTDINENPSSKEGPLEEKQQTAPTSSEEASSLTDISDTDSQPPNNEKVVYTTVAPKLEKPEKPLEEQVDVKAPQNTDIKESPSESPTPPSEEVDIEQQHAITTLLAARKKESKKQRLTYYSIYTVLCLISLGGLAGYYLKTSASAQTADRSISELLVAQKMSDEISGLMANHSALAESDSTDNTLLENTPTTENKTHRLEKNLLDHPKKPAEKIGTLTPAKAPHTNKTTASHAIEEHVTLENESADNLSPIINTDDLAVIEAYKSSDKNKKTSVSKTISKSSKKPQPTTENTNITRKLYNTKGNNNADSNFALKQKAYQYYQQGQLQQARRCLLYTSPSPRDRG